MEVQERYEIKFAHKEQLFCGVELHPNWNYVLLSELHPNDELILSIEAVCNQLIIEYDLSHEDFLCVLRLTDENGNGRLYHFELHPLDRNGKQYFPNTDLEGLEITEQKLEFLIRMQRGLFETDNRVEFN